MSVPTGPSTRLQMCWGSHRTWTTLATLQHCKVVKVSLSSISLGVILRITRTKQAPVLVGFTVTCIIADLDQETLHKNKRAVCPPFLSRHRMHVPTAFPAPWAYLCSSEYLIYRSRHPYSGSNALAPGRKSAHTCTRLRITMRNIGFGRGKFAKVLHKSRQSTTKMSVTVARKAYCMQLLRSATRNDN